MSTVNCGRFARLQWSFAKHDTEDTKCATSTPGIGRDANLKKKNPRHQFSCACPLYTRVEFKSPVTGEILFSYHGSLAKYGIGSVEAAHVLLDTWAMQYLSGQVPPAVEQQKRADESRSALSVAEAVEGYLRYKESRKKNPETIRKLADILKPLAPFAEARGVKLLKEVDFDLLVAFEETWKGKRVKDPDTGEWKTLPKSAHGKQKYQEVVRMFFRHWHNIGKITKNPAAALEPIATSDAEIHVYEAKHVKNLFKVIEDLFPKIAARVEAFMLFQYFSAFRISDVCTLAVDELQADNTVTHQQWKTKRWVSVAVPQIVVDKLRSITPTSERYFFWTGNGQVETCAKDWSANLLKVFRAAGMPEGFRSHAFRDTVATRILEKGGSLEDAQMALGHGSRKTTEKYYVNALAG